MSGNLICGTVDESQSELDDEADLRVRTYAAVVHGTRALLLSRMERRPGHFMKAGMLDSQLATLETPDPENEVGGHGHIAVVKLGKGADETEEVGIEGVAREASAAAEQWVGAVP